MCDRHCRLIAALAGLLAAGWAQAASNRILFLRPASSAALDPSAVQEVVSIYTRDLLLAVEADADAPPVVTAESLGKIVELVRARDLRLAFWYELRPAEHDLVLYAVTSGESGPDIHALKVANVDPPEIYRAIALKVRAVLTGAARLEQHLPTPQLPVAGSPRAPASVKPAAQGASAPVRVRVLAAYRLTLPIDTSLARHGVALEGALPLGKHLEIALGVDVSTQAGVTLSEGSASLFDFPVRVAVRGVLRSGRIEGALGALVGVHVLSVSAVGFDGTRGDALTAAAGLGGELVGRIHASAHVAGELRFQVEAILPPTEFSLHGVKSVETGSVLFGLSAGLSFAAP